ncbi:MAG: DUF3108 domain-containing protein [Nitrosomonadales bacterium]|nr:DUF3108 domain-containing protein [Nitrosomonadales bacterium]
MKLRLDTPSRRISFAVGVSFLVHALALWGPNIQLPQFKSSLPPLVAKLEALPAAPAKPKRKTAAPKPAPEPAPQAEEQPQPPQDAAQAASAPVATSVPAETETLASEADNEVERPPLPKRAQLTFGVNKGIGGLRVGKAVHTLEIDDGHYILHAVTQTVGLARLFKSYELTQYSSGSYGKHGLQPDQFFEQRKDKLTTLRYTAEFDHAAQVARFTTGNEVVLPPDTLDILSVMYQFPPMAHTEMVAVSVSNGRKIERYEFEIDTEEEIDTPLGRLLTVRLHKMHAPNEEGLDIWLAREYRLFPVKMRFIEKNGEVTGEAVITDIRVSEEEGVRSDAVN